MVLHRPIEITRITGHLAVQYSTSQATRYTSIGLRVKPTCLGGPKCYAALQKTSDSYRLGFE